MINLASTTRGRLSSVLRVADSSPVARKLKTAIIFGPRGAYDAVTGEPLPITAAFGVPFMGSTPYGYGLRTPNGAGATIALGEDWSGPCTVIYRCWINGVDSNFGGIWSKNAGGTSQQFGVGRNGTSNNWYIGRSDSATTTLTSSSITGDSNRLAVFAVINTANDSTAQPVALYRDGALIQSAAASTFNQTTGAGSLHLGSARNLDAAFDSDVWWYEFLRFDQVLSAQEIAWIGRDTAKLFRRAPVRQVVPVSAGGGGSHDATGAMSAQSATVSGSAAAVATYTSSGALTAQAATVAGSATHTVTHASSGVLEAQAASVSGAANHVGAHGSTGALEAQAATVAGSADHAAGGAFSATGALTAQAAAVAGSAAHLTLHTATGALASGSATAAGAAVHYTLHTATGDLVADAASISGSALHEGDGAEVAKPFTGAGRPRRTRPRVVVEIDGEDFIAESSEEAQAILDQAKEAAEEKAKVAIERATKARNRPTRKVMADARKALELPAISAPDLGGYAEEISRQIEDIYQSAIQTIEVAALLRKRELEEEDDEDILMLL